MINEIIGLIEAQAKSEARKVVLPTALTAIGGMFVVFAMIALFAALFYWLEPMEGPLAASLIVAAVAFIAALIAFLPLAFKRSPPTPPPQPRDAALPQLVGLMSRSAGGLGPRQLVVAATLLAAALVISGLGEKKQR